MHAGLARRSLGWRIRIAVLAMALVGAASTAGVWHQEHAADQDCAVCQFRHQPAALSESVQVGFAGVPKPLEPAPAAAWIASGHTRRLPARAPPA